MNDESTGDTEPTQTPLFHAEHADRYARQDLIRSYQETFECRLIVVFDALLDYSVTVLEDLIFAANPAQDIHVLLATPGGDGEAALRMVRSLQARCRELTVVVPDKAKSAGTIFALGAHYILMGPTSDLGPIDPQLVLNAQDPNSLISAKDLIAALEAAQDAVQQKPETYPIHASLLANVNALQVQQARSALARTDDLMRDALSSVKGRSEQEVHRLFNALHIPLIEAAMSHAAVFGIEEARKADLPVIEADPSAAQWRSLWRLWMKYFVNNDRIYEGATASKVVGPWALTSP
jgi:ATP-dependent protease ClpP protease subunit